MPHFNAPWGRTLILSSSLATLLCAGIPVYVVVRLDEVQLGQPLSWPLALPLLVVVAALLFVVRGYTVAGDTLLVHRLLWATRVPLAGLQEARFAPEELARSIRTLGNGGLFSFTGRFWNKRLGRYQAFLTDHARAVILKYPKRTVVVSPDDPEAFVRAVAPPKEG